YNTSPVAPDGTGMSSTAAQLAANFKLGINIGNTMEAPGGETGWGNPVITQLWVDSVKKAGFTAIRIPCRWDGTYYNSSTKKWVYNEATHLSDTKKEQIDPAWLERVKQVVQYCINDGMYVILNIHEGWQDCGATGAALDTVKAKQRALWEQIATGLRDFDEHLMFASSNEPYGYSSNFSFTLPTVTNLYDYHQIFINAVRSTGGKNAYRTLVIQAPVTSSDLADYFTPGGLPGIPADNVPNKLMLEFHYYAPFNFCLDTDTTSAFFYWGKNYHSTTDLSHNATFGEETYVDGVFSLMQKEFADKGIPVVVGEVGAFPPNSSLTGNNRTLSLASRGHYYSYVTHSALTHGALPFVWDTGEIFNRNTGAVQNKQLLDSLKYGASH
ncbi:MAG TPA: glycoside hydrolase family 5 protein, partial [Bacteroidales bacterium]